MSKAKTDYQIIQKVNKTTIIINVILSIAKLVAGIIFVSFSVISDSVHTLSDIITTVIVMVGIKLANKPQDKEHNYGHEKIESIFTVILSFVLFAIGLFLGYQAITALIYGNNIKFSYLLIAVTVLSIIVKELMYQYGMHYARKFNSSALKADAWHHRTDSLSSIAVLIGLVLTFTLGWTWAEPVATILIAVLIIKTSISIVNSAVSQLTDKAADQKTIDKIKEIISNVPGVIAVDKLLTRQHANMLYVDIEIAANGNLKLNQSHKIAEVVHSTLEGANLHIKHCTVHVNPYKETQDQTVKNFFD